MRNPGAGYDLPVMLFFKFLLRERLDLRAYDRYAASVVSSRGRKKVKWSDMVCHFVGIPDRLMDIPAFSAIADGIEFRDILHGLIQR